MNIKPTKHLRQSLRFKVLPASDLSQSQIAAWTSLATTDRQFRSPFFSPGYTRLVANCVANVMAGLIIQDGEIVGIFPYEEFAAGQGRPVGSVFCDYQGVVIRPDIVWAVEDLLIGIELDAWRYDHILASQTQWNDFHQVQDVSWSVDLSQGFAGFEAHLKAAKRGALVDARRKRRMLEREVGSLTFTPHVIDHGLLDELLAWKSAQWEQSGWRGRFTSEWEQQLMHSLIETDDPDFAGLFSVIRAGSRPIAMHVGMRSRQVWHYWTTAYDPAFSRYSPGNLMLVEMLRYAPSVGISEFDMGKEDFEYKRRFHTYVIPLAEGIAHTGKKLFNGGKYHG